jgi:type II secretory ATPase GspE/PulE/Tfp pilus assembly ATPase PilB-like protein
MPITERDAADHPERKARHRHRHAGQENGVRDLRQSGLVKVRLGVTTLEEVISCTNE